MTWCPCHGDAEGVRCFLRGDEPLVTRESCGCARLALYPPLRRNEVYAFGKRRASHELGCELGTVEFENPPFPKQKTSDAEVVRRGRAEKKAVKEAKVRKNTAAQTVLLK